MIVKRFTKEHWAIMSENAHALCFRETRPREMNNIDFALLVVDENDVPLSYVTCREYDSQTVYMSFGGSFPSAKGTTISWRTYEALHHYLSLTYKESTTLVANYNTVMLKFALKAGMKIVGTRTIDGVIYIDFFKEYQDGKTNQAD